MAEGMEGINVSKYNLEKVNDDSINYLYQTRLDQKLREYSEKITSKYMSI